MSEDVYHVTFLRDGGFTIQYADGTSAKELEAVFRALRQLPEKNGSRAVRNAVAKGARMVRRETKGVAPVGATGNLKKSIELKKERQRKKGKAVYEIRFSPKFNELLQKPIKAPGKFGGKSPYAYYPSSMEFGFLTAKGKQDGRHFMRSAADGISEAAKDATMENLWTQIEKEWGKLADGS